MRALVLIFVGVAFLIFLAMSPAMSTQQIPLTDQEAEEIGTKIFYNECGGKVENLVAWNEGEDFMSLGIGHFIWYPTDKPGPFDESFPKLLKFIKEHDIPLPGWLDGAEVPHCPWVTREKFLHDRQNRNIDDLRRFLIDTKELQVRFIINRLKAALPKMLLAAPEVFKPRIETQFYSLASTPSGVYALIDYVNFSGEGTLATERYKGRGWGLLQVLERMKEDKHGIEAVEAFAQAAEEILTERVNNAPPERNEQRWLPGWKSRLSTYIQK
ncbi:MAG: hypothetical protein PHS37_07080 [Candidatus Omnitrophica bacterium]|nr:hypothetical protein [Candidatus Omnitrophota bacterium]